MTAKINLAPEVYQHHQQEKRLRSLATTIAIAVTFTSLALVGIAAAILGGQKIYLAVLQKQINANQLKLTSYADLPSAITAEQHLESWNTLSQQKVKVSKFFEILEKVAPQGTAATKVSIDSGNSMTVQGTSKNFSLASAFTKSLEDSNGSQTHYFSDTKLSGVDSNGDGTVNFQLKTLVGSEVLNGE